LNKCWSWRKKQSTTTIDDLPRGRGFPSAAGGKQEEKEGDAAAAAAAGTRKARKTRQKNDCVRSAGGAQDC